VANDPDPDPDFDFDFDFGAPGRSDAPFGT
jgi:hypothetical protein